MMKIPMFETYEEYRAWSHSRADMYQRELDRQTDAFVQAVNGVGKKEFLEWNHVDPELADFAWAGQLAWRREGIKRLERKIKKLRAV